MIVQPPPPELYEHLSPIVEAVFTARRTGYMSANAPMTDIEVCYKAFGYGFGLIQFIRFFRAFEGSLNERDS